MYNVGQYCTEDINMFDKTPAIAKLVGPTTVEHKAWHSQHNDYTQTL